MASSLQRLMYTFYILSSFLLSIFWSVNSEKCTEYYTLFEKNSCEPVNATKIKPALINTKTCNIYKNDMLSLNSSLHEYLPEDCFFELMCDHVETICEQPVNHSTIEVQLENSTALLTPSTTELEVINTTTVKEEDTTEPECKQLFTYIEVKSCNGANSTMINPVAAELEMYSNLSISQYILEDDPSCPFVPLEYQFAQLMCEEVTTECVPLNRTAQAVTANSTQNTALIAVGAVAAVGLTSALTYYGYVKITEILQSATYYLPQ